MKTKYYVNREKKTVVAVIRDCKDDLCDYVESHLKRDGNQMLVLSFGGGMDKLYLKDKYVGTARCDDEDNFDEEKGKKLAAQRASLKYEEDRSRKMSSFASVVSDMLCNMTLEQVDRANEEFRRLGQTLEEFGVPLEKMNVR